MRRQHTHDFNSGLWHSHRFSGTCFESAVSPLLCWITPSRPVHKRSVKMGGKKKHSWSANWPPYKGEWRAVSGERARGERSRSGYDDGRSETMCFVFNLFIFFSIFTPQNLIVRAPRPTIHYYVTRSQRIVGIGRLTALCSPVTVEGTLAPEHDAAHAAAKTQHHHVGPCIIILLLHDFCTTIRVCCSLTHTGQCNNNNNNDGDDDDDDDDYWEQKKKKK